MFRKTRVLWRVHKCLSDTLYDRGDRDPKSPSKLMQRIEELTFLSFRDRCRIYRKRTVPDAALQIMIDLAAGALREIGTNSSEAMITLEALKRLEPTLVEATVREAIDRAAAP